MKKAIRNSSWSNPSRLKIVSEEVQKSPDNLTHAFRNISKKIGISESAVMQAWYAKLREQFPQFATGSAKNVFVNRKNTPKKDDSLIHEKVVSTENVKGLKVVTVMKYYAI